MKVSEMNERQKTAFYNIKYAAINLIGGLENAMQDNAETNEYYISAEKALNDHAKLVETVYQMATTNLYREGFELFGKTAVQNLGHTGKVEIGIASFNRIFVWVDDVKIGIYDKNKHTFVD